MKKVLLMLIIVTFTVTAYAGDPVEVWNKVYDSGESEQAQSVAVDALGNVYITGLFYGGVDNDYLVIKYNPDGDTLWTRTFDGGSGNDHVYGVAVDASSNVYVAGASHNGTDFDWRTICYDTDGNELWNVPYDGGNDDRGTAVAVDETGNVYVAGRSSNGIDTDFLTIRYDSDGDTLWTRTYDGGYNDGGSGVALDASDNPCVTGYSFNGNNYDYRTICYDSQGNVRWNEFFDGDSTDYGDAIAVDASGYVYVTGCSYDGNDGTDYDYRTIKYDSLGNIRWNEVYDVGIGGDDYGNDIAVDPYFVYVTGSSWQGTCTYWRTIRYDKEGSIGWNVFFDSGNNENDYGSGVAVDDSGYVYVTGYTYNGTDWDFRTIKYQQDDYPAVSEQPSLEPSSVTLEVSDNLTDKPIIHYYLPVDQPGTLTFYSADGRKLETYALDAAQSTYTWDTNAPSGVYFVKLGAMNKSSTAKVVLIK